MVTFSHILYPTDLSDVSHHAAPYAAVLAGWYGATLSVLHVVPTLESLVGPADGLHAGGPIVYPPTPQEIEQQMRRSLSADVPSDVTVKFDSVVGNPAVVIVDRAVSTPADLIVMGTHGRSGFDRLLSGSVTEKVLRKAPCPVLTIPPHAPAQAGGPVFKRVLCPVDFSPASQQAVGFALDLARQSNGSVTVLSVVEWLAEEDLAGADVSLVAYRQQLLDAARTRLSSLLADEPRTWCAVDEIVTAGRPYREVLRVAAERSCDLIVIGAHGRGAGALPFLGSTTPPVVRSATCPVLVVRSPDGTKS